MSQKELSRSELEIKARLVPQAALGAGPKRVQARRAQTLPTTHAFATSCWMSTCRQGRF
jgi:hypothetical protein